VTFVVKEKPLENKTGIVWISLKVSLKEKCG
jgi:hypothetical protein